MMEDGRPTPSPVSLRRERLSTGDDTDGWTPVERKS
jgi:hypothetical protein